RSGMCRGHAVRGLGSAIPHEPVRTGAAHQGAAAVHAGRRARADRRRIEPGWHPRHAIDQRLLRRQRGPRTVGRSPRGGDRAVRPGSHHPRVRNVQDGHPHRADPSLRGPQRAVRLALRRDRSHGPLDGAAPGEPARRLRAGARQGSRRAGTVRPAHGGHRRPHAAGRQSSSPRSAPSSRGPLGDAPSASRRSPAACEAVPDRPSTTPRLKRASSKELQSMDAYEPFSEAVREDPYPYYAALRDEAPVYWAEGAHAWCVSRSDDVQLVLRSPELFSSDAMRTMLMGARPGVNPLEDPEVMARALALTQALAFPLEELIGGRQLLSEDPPRHTAMRNIV